MNLTDKLKNIIKFSKSSSEAQKAMEREFINEYILESIETLGVPIETLGLTLEDLDDNKYMNKVDVEGKDNFAKAKITPLYRYVAHTSSGYGSSGVGANTRNFCSKLSKRTSVALMRYRDILKLNGRQKGMGLKGANVYNVFQWRGGVNCRHIWVKYYYNSESKRLIEAPRSDQPRQLGKGSVPNA